MQVTNMFHYDQRGSLNFFLTLLYRLVLVISQRCNKETHLSHGAPVVQDPDAPHTGPQRLVERWTVVGELCARIYQDVIGGCYDIGGVNPDDSDSDIRPFIPLLHAYYLIHGTHQAADVSEHPLFGIPFCANLKENSKSRRKE